MTKKPVGWVAVVILMLAAYAAPVLAHAWTETEFANRPLYAYPLPSGRDDIIGTLTTYRIEKGDTLLDVGRWFGLSAKEISDANGHMDWWLPPPGRVVILPTAHILPAGSRAGIILNVPEMRIYYYFPSPAYTRHRKGKLIATAFHGARVVYTFPVGLGRFDWKTPLGVWRVTAKVKDPTWVLPEDIYQEHLERDGEADHVVPGGDPDNPLGHYKLDLSIPEYGLHGTNVPWGIGMTVSHGCVRLFPEDIERLYSKTPVGTPGEFVYQPVKFGWRGDALYAEVHDDLYGKYPGLWRLATQEVQQQNLAGKVDLTKLEKAVELRAGIPTYVGFGTAPAEGAIPDTANADATAPDSTMSSAADSSASTPAPAEPSAMSAPTEPSAMAAPAETAPVAPPAMFPAVPHATTVTGTPPASTAPAMPPTTIAPATATDDDDAPDNSPGGDWQSTR
jgi:L,D-transpeptidase ErfK/SrfK